MTQRSRQIALGLLLLAGLMVFVIPGVRDWGIPLHLLLLPLPLLLLAVPAIGNPAIRALEALAAPSSKVRARIAVVLGACASLYFLKVALTTNRPQVPQWHDESMNLLQMRMMAAGRLWMPEHPLADFFETLFVQVHGVYASIYFPGTALLFLPTVLLDLHCWLMPLMACGAVVALTYMLVTELCDGVAGLLAAWLMMGLEQLRVVSVMLLSQPVMTLLGLVMLLSWVRWRRDLHVGWAITFGAAAGWAAITRPLDAVCFGVPLAIAMVLRLWREPRKRWLGSIAPAAAATLPFLLLQGVLNLGTTGHLFETPYVRYLEAYQPGTVPGFGHFDPSIRPQTTLAQKLDYYDDFIVPDLQEHTLASAPAILLLERLPVLLKGCLPHMLLVVLLPAGLLALRDWRWAPVAILPLFMGLYALNPIFLDHYPVVLAPLVLLLLMLGRESLLAAFSAARGYLLPATTLLLLVTGLSGLPELNMKMGLRYKFELVTLTAEIVRDLPYKPAVLLFVYDPGMNYHDEPVYNVETAWPDDAQVIRAHDRGRDNERIIRYYAQRPPLRHFYRLDRLNNEVTYLGRADELLKLVEQRQQADAASQPAR